MKLQSFVKVSSAKIRGTYTETCCPKLLSKFSCLKVNQKCIIYKIGDLLIFSCHPRSVNIIPALLVSRTKGKSPLQVLILESEFVLCCSSGVTRELRKILNESTPHERSERILLITDK